MLARRKATAKLSSSKDDGAVEEAVNLGTHVLRNGFCSGSSGEVQRWMGATGQPR